MRHVTSLVVALSTLAAPALFADDAIALFNGHDLSGWTQKGGHAKYSVEDGCIVGQAVLNTDNSFLCTDAAYDNFILDYDFKVDPRLNSGVQIRSECFDQPTTVEWRDKTIHIPAGRVHGYQVEIDGDTARGRLWTAGIYDEGRRGWLYPGDLGGTAAEFSKQGGAIFNTNNWNHVRVVASGDSIKTYLNDVLCAHIHDSMTPKGFIALQVHNIGNNQSMADAEVRFRNLRLQPISDMSVAAEPTPNTLTAEEKQEGWRLLWDGKTSYGWRSANSEEFPEKSWILTNGEMEVVSSGNAEAQAGGDIITREQFSNFELKVDFKLTPGCNSGIKYFVHPNIDPVTGTGAKASVGSAIGYEYQVLDDLRHPDAKLGRNGDRTLGSLYDLLPASQDKPVNPIGEWNTAHIIVRGNHIQHWLNGKKILDYDRTSPEFKDAFEKSKFRHISGFPTWTEGHILLQEHGSRVAFRNVKIRVLPPSTT